MTKDCCAAAGNISNGNFLVLCFFIIINFGHCRRSNDFFFAVSNLYFYCHIPESGGVGTRLYELYRCVRPKGYGFSAVLVINSVSNLAILIIN